MTVVKIGDGLGNQIYNYVVGYAAAKFNDESLTLDTSECDNSKGFRPYLLDNFNIKYDFRVSYSNSSFFKKVYKRLLRDFKYRVVFEDNKFFDFLNINVFRRYFRETYIHGWYQNLNYFYLYESEFREMLTRKEQFPEIFNDILRVLRSENSCVLHIRTGDIKELSSDYYKRAIDIIVRQTKVTRFIVFSNNDEIARNLLAQLNYLFIYIDDVVQDVSDVDSFFLMKECSKFIIPNSTFSRWAAILNNSTNKCVVCPNQFIVDGVNYNKYYYPSDWHFIDF